tara:strand:- start:51 stop:398 length:348 start_codon:yes stop_codon:yes gene_type:complete
MTVKDYNLFNTGKFYYQWGHNVIGIYPTPNESKDMRIHYVGDVDDMVKGNDSPHESIPEEYHEALVAYAVLQLVKRLSPAAYSLYKQEWEELKEELAMGSKIIREEIVQTSHKDF